MKTRIQTSFTSFFSKLLGSATAVGAKNDNQPVLKDLFKNDFYVGVALNLNQISGNEPYSLDLVKKHFNSISPENILKWEEVHPEPDRYNFDAATVMWLLVKSTKCI